jgi:hypothetical protein
MSATNRIINYASYDRARDGLKTIVVIHLVFFGLTLFNGWADWWTNPVSRYSLVVALATAVLYAFYDWRSVTTNWAIVVAYFGLFASEFLRYGFPETGYQFSRAEYIGRGGLFDLVMS